MKGTIKFPYSKFQGFFGLALLVPMLIGCLVRIACFYNLNRMNDVASLLIAAIVLSIMLYYFLSMFFIPAMKEEIALELNEAGIISKVRNINLKWNEITDVRFCVGKSSNSIAIVLVDKNDFKSRITSPFRKITMWIGNLFYSTPLLLPLSAIKGNDREIFETIKNYLYEYKATKKKLSLSSTDAQQKDPL